MGDAHEARQVDDALAVLKDAGRHAIALALEYPAARPAGRDAAGILAAVLEVVETLVQVGSRLGARRVGKEKTQNAAHGAGLVRSTDDEVIGLDEVEGWPARSDGRVAGLVEGARDGVHNSRQSNWPNEIKSIRIGEEKD